MSVSNLFQQLGTRWHPDSDAVNAADGVLLRADNVVPDKAGALDLRRGSTLLHTALDGGTLDNIHSLHTVELSNGTSYRAMGVGDKLFIDANSQGTFDGSGDIAMGDDAYQMFFARGTTKKKFDGTNWYNWGIQAPASPPTLAAVPAITKSVATFGTSDSPAVTVLEGSGSIATETDQGGSANEASKIIPDGSTFRGTLQRLWTTDQNYSTISGIDGTATDLFDLYLKFEDPRAVEKVKVVFGLDNSSTLPFNTDRFEFEFDVRGGVAIPVKDLESEGYSAFESAVLSSLAAVRPQDVTGIKTPEQVKAILASVGATPSTTAVSPADANVWGHLTVSRGQFKRIGNTTSRGWDTVRGFKVTYTVRSGSTATATFSDAIFIGGGDRSLTGTFRCVIRAARNFSQYYELSPPSEQSDPINLNHQTPQITIPATVLSQLDDQADQIWVYLFGGWLDTYYRFAVVPATVRGGMTMDELTNPAGSNLDAADERSRITGWGYTMNVDDASGDLVLTLLRSEMDALTENERLEPYQMVPPDNIVAVAGPHQGRMFVLTSEGYVYPSTVRSPSSFNSIQVIDLTRYGNPLWMKKTGQGITVGMEKDVVFIAGSGEEEEGGFIDYRPQALNVGNPPVDSCAWVDGNAIVYRSVDGMMLLTGSSMQPVPQEGVSLLWRGMNRHGIEGLNITGGRFRCAVDNGLLYILAPEGSATTSNVIYRFQSSSSQWSRLVFDEVDSFHSIYKEPNGTLTAGDEDGNLWKLDFGSQDNNADVGVEILTPITDGGNPLARKDAFDLQIHADTGGSTGSISLYREGDASDLSTYDFDAPSNSVYRINASDFGTFLKTQLHITGSFARFTLQHLNLTYRVRPQHSVFLDTGYLLPSGVGDLVWLYEVEFDAILANDVTMRLYINDTQKGEDYTITALTGRRPYIVALPRGTKGYRPRLTFATTADNATGSIGFEVYGVRVRMATTGNQDGAEYKTVYPVPTAP